MPDANPKPRILIFDSGVGGLTVAREVSLLCPTVTIDYLSDNVGFPYGEKPGEFIIQRSLTLLTHMLQRHARRWELVIVACNTASTLALPALREQLSIPVIGVVPAIKPAAERSATQYIGLLATPATINRPYTHALINDYARHCRVISVGSAALVQLAERKLRGEAIETNDVKAILRPFQQVNTTNPTPALLDTLVLACTHFPLLKQEIQASFDHPVTVIDSGQAIARRTQALLGLGSDSAQTPTAVGSYWYTTQNRKANKPIWPHHQFFAKSMPVYV